MCLIAQISSLPSHRVALNVGFQTNYNLPYELPSFYSPIFWARKISKTSNPLVNFFERMVDSSDTKKTNYTSPNQVDSDQTTDLLGDSGNTEMSIKIDEKLEGSTKNIYKRIKRWAAVDSDISAGMFYNEILEILEL